MSQQQPVNQIQSVSLSLWGLAFGILIIFPALLSMDVLGVHFGFSFLPVAAVLYWPPTASYSWSLLGIFLFGLLYDMASSSPLGMWTLAFLILFVVLGGGADLKGGFSQAIGGFTLSVLLVLIVVFVVGRLTIGQWPPLSGLLANGLASIVVFPIIYWIRSLYIAIRGSSETPRLRE